VLTIDCIEIARPTDGLFCGRQMADPWTFDFTLPAPTGTVVSPGAASTLGVATLTLSELRITPTMISYRVALSVDGTEIDHWTTTTATLRRDDLVFATNGDYHVTQDPGAQGSFGDENEFSTAAGTEAATGTWEIAIPEISYTSQGSTEAVSEKGPWTFEVDVP
jgi:hypothetical protein